MFRVFILAIVSACSNSSLPKVAIKPLQSTNRVVSNVVNTAVTIFVSAALQNTPINLIPQACYATSMPGKDYLLSIQKSEPNSRVTQWYDNDLIRGLASGAVSRATKEVLLHPFDTVRARQQLAGESNFKGNNTALLADLYAGIVPALIGGIPAGAVFFGVKDYIKGYLKGASFGLSREEITIVSVVVANVFYWLVRSPAEELKTKKQVGQSGKGAGFLSLQSIRQIYFSGGLNGILGRIYDSYASNVAYALPVDIAKFIAYESISAELFHAAPGVKISGLDAAVAGALAGLAAQTVTTPLDVTRTRIMTRSDTITDEPVSSSANPLTVLLLVSRQEGLGALWAGLGPRAARAIGSGAIQFASYELTQNALSS